MIDGVTKPLVDILETGSFLLLLLFIFNASIARKGREAEEAVLIYRIGFK